MKKIIVLFILFSITIFANELKTVYSYQKALEKAKNENKIVLFMTSIKGCPVCDYMKDIVFEREAVLNYLDKNFVVVIKDAEREIYPQRFHTRDMPTFYFIDPFSEDEIKEPKVGGLTPEKFLALLKNVMGEDINIDANSSKENNKTITKN